jgi:hypothetical protein
MSEVVRLPVKKWGATKWADLGSLGHIHEIIGEKFDMKDNNYSFAGGHRVRLFKVKNNVHFKIPEGVTLDISGVTPAEAPRRQGSRR